MRFAKNVFSKVENCAIYLLMAMNNYNFAFGLLEIATFISIYTPLKNIN